jgi:hypothetical protein
MSFNTITSIASGVFNNQVALQLLWVFLCIVCYVPACPFSFHLVFGGCVNLSALPIVCYFQPISRYAYMNSCAVTPWTSATQSLRNENLYIFSWMHVHVRVHTYFRTDRQLSHRIIHACIALQVLTRERYHFNSERDIWRPHSPD